jgi:hypothetical protein
LKATALSAPKRVSNISRTMLAPTFRSASFIHFLFSV